MSCCPTAQYSMKSFSEALLSLSVKTYMPVTKQNPAAMMQPAAKRRQRLFFIGRSSPYLLQHPQLPEAGEHPKSSGPIERVSFPLATQVLHKDRFPAVLG